MTEQSPFLSGLNAEKQFADRMEKSLRSNKVLQRVLEIRRHVERLSMRFLPFGRFEEQ